MPHAAHCITTDASGRCPDDTWIPEEGPKKYYALPKRCAVGIFSNVYGHPDDVWVPTPSESVEVVSDSQTATQKSEIDQWLGSASSKDAEPWSFLPDLTSEDYLLADPFLTNCSDNRSSAALDFKDTEYVARSKATHLVMDHGFGSKKDKISQIDLMEVLLTEFSTPAAHAQIKGLIENGVRIRDFQEILALKKFWRNATHLWLRRRFDKPRKQWVIECPSKVAGAEFSWSLASLALEVLPFGQLADLLDGSWRQEWQYMIASDFRHQGQPLPSWFFSYTRFISKRVVNMELEVQSELRLASNISGISECRMRLKQADKEKLVSSQAGLFSEDVYGTKKAKLKEEDQ